MTNISSKQNTPKLKWWQKGAIVALIMVFLFLLLIWQGSYCLRTRGDIDICPSAMFMFLLLPFFYALLVYLIVCLFVFLTIKFRGITRIILITIAAILIMAGIYYFFHYQIEKAIYKINPKIGTRLAVEYCEKFKPSETKDNCYLMGTRNLSLKDFSICEKIKGSYYKDKCYEIIGMSFGDVAIGLAYKCEQISNECERNQCFTDILREHKSFRMSKGENICQIVTTKKVSECMANTFIGGNYKDYCYSILEGATINILNCEEREDLSKRDDCYLARASVKDDSNLCEKIQSQSKKASCYSHFAVSKKELAFCEKIPDHPLVYKCYTDVANAASDLSICKKIQNPSEKYKCYVNYSFFHQSPSCEEIQTQLGVDKDICYLDIAKKAYDINFSLCKRIESENIKDQCYSYFIDRAVAWNSPRSCEEIEFLDRKDICYFEIAVHRKGDVATKLCEKIKSQIIKDQCFKQTKPETVLPETAPPEKITPSPGAALPLPPTNLSCESGDGQVILNWNNPDIPNFSHIHIYRSTAQQLGELVYDNVTIESLVDRGLTNGLLYYYTLRAVDTLGRESVSVPDRIFTCIGRPSLKISEYKIYKHKIYGYDMIFSETPILKVIVFDDRNENGMMDSNEKGLQNIHLDEYRNDEFFGGSMTSENGVVNFFEFPLYQKVTIIPSEEDWLVTNIDKYKYEFILSEIPKEGRTAYFSLIKGRPKIECDKTDFKMAFILLVQNLDAAIDERLDTLNRIKKEFSYYFPRATRNLTGMDTDDKIYIMKTEEDMCRPNCGEETTWFFLDRIAKKFYETHDDIYDFISVYTTFKTPERYHTTVIQNIEGIGQSIFDNSKQYGSNRILRGINYMGDVDNFIMSYESLMEFGPINVLLHETGHQWCCYVGDNFARGKNNAKLEIIQQNIHFYIGLQSPYETQTVMGAHKWVPDNGVFKQKPEEKVELRKYHPFQLYFMGLLPEEEYDTKFQTYDAGYNGNWNFENAVPYKQVGVRDIIQIEGERICIP